MTAAISFDVAIVGCGPVGALAANLFAAAGLRTLVIDRESAPHPLPRAVHLDHEMMRLFQSVGLAGRLSPAMHAAQGHLHVGADRGVIRYMGTVGKPQPFGWAADYFFFQPELETVLREGLARFPCAELRVDTAFEAYEQDRDGVTVALQTGETRSTVRARYLIACDGARSAVRKAMGVALDDLGFEEPWLVVDAEVDGPVRFPDLWGVPEAADLQRLSVMMCDPARPATVVPGRGALRRWEFMLLPGEDEAAMTRPEMVDAMLQPYLAGVPHRIVRAATYRFHGLIAERWQDDRVFLAGDAAHQTPPFFGQGMCHGMRDVANLAWKITAVVRGDAAPALLSSYQPERDPHVRAVVTAAVEAGRYICELDADKAAARDAAMRARAGVSGTAADLIPPIRTGIVAAQTPGAGERFIQPYVAGELLDDVTGGGWRLFTPDPVEADADVAVIDTGALADGGAVTRWLAERGARALLVRPDFYTFGTSVGNGADLLRARADALATGRLRAFDSQGEVT